MSEMTHKFEKAGLGLAPFKYAGFELKLYKPAPGVPARAGSSCDYCGNAIARCFWVVSADGRRFKVGSDCIAKVGDAGLNKAIAPEIRQARREAEAAKIEAGRAEVCAAWYPGLDLGASPAGRGSFAEYFAWMMVNAGNSGKLRAIREARKRLQARF